MKYKYLKPEDISRLKSFEFAPRAMAEGYLAGRHHANSLGSSTEFRDYRPYSPGDDIRMVDWRVYARTDRHYLCTFEQETNTDCHIFLDSSASMGFGEALSKLDYASFFAACLCYLVVRCNDLVSLQIFDRDIRRFFPPGSTDLHLRQLMLALEDNLPGAETSLAAALHRAFPLLSRRGTLIVLSDFFDEPAAIFNAFNPYQHRGFEIHLFHIMAPEELDLTPRGLTAFVDMENNQRVISHTDQLRKHYRQAMNEHIRGLRELSIRRRIHYNLARTDTHYFELFDQLVK